MCVAKTKRVCKIQVRLENCAGHSTCAPILGEISIRSLTRRISRLIAKFNSGQTTGFQPFQCVSGCNNSATILSKLLHFFHRKAAIASNRKDEQIVFCKV